MPCTKNELASAINSYAAARVSGDANLINFGASAVASMIDTLEFAEEEETESTEE